MTWRIADGHPWLSHDERTIVATTLRHFEGERFHTAAWVVMNDHVHVVVTPVGPHQLEEIVQSWKSLSARELQRAGARQGAVWQREYMDHIVRSETALRQICAYVLHNPWKRWPEIEDYPWCGVGSQGE